jgi:hypothetical protein
MRRDDSWMRRRRKESEMREVVLLLQGLGLLLMSIDWHLEKLVILLGEDDEESDA